ncbi:MAG TPA: excinuclease ABC subunit UvrB [Thermotogota bacterium]|jgi:excinuclease ABC subunit B|nr:excinuclease ABC subunit UvrB [Thermotogota bacterium]NLH20154.1 excinuclease ABC subunit UvrB [Thermotogaceae bacterium]OQC32082.1 MAG: UvrABC system protein B [Thermotogota bacterium ADurb.Bin062]HNW46750.1 excinuclease ABC subunit UvrB [Thermotogota bacterium]HNY81972.1 excinuclease ABC subunit UvrB [Thermotogota bacterium]
MAFKINQEMRPSGDQPEAIERLITSIQRGHRFQTLLGVTGSGKTFTMAHTIAALNRSALIISPNKTLAAQLYREFKDFFPENRVEFFISYYDYYQPEAYIPTKDIYVEKEAQINDIIQRMRLSTLKSVLTRKDVIIVASVSCIYATGDPDDFKNINLFLEVGKTYSRRSILSKLTQLQYERSEDLFSGGKFRWKGEALEIFPTYDEGGIRFEFFDETLERVYSFDPVSRKVIEEFDRMVVFPTREYITTEEKIRRALESIQAELEERIRTFKDQNKLLEAQRIEQRTLQDMEMLKELGYCTGIENYSRHFDGRAPGEPPWTLLDFFGDDYLLFIDESHISVPQIGAMYRGDRSRKLNLVEYGFRLPSAIDNRPLQYEEFLEKVHQAVFVSATPGEYERGISDTIVEQIIRPTGLVDPQIEVRTTQNQVDDLIDQIHETTQKKERVLVLTLTKSMAERLSDYLQELGIRSLYLHSELGTIERVEVLKKLRKGEIEVVVGINLLREGLDLPEVSLVAILDADKEGFLRSETTLIQIVGRAARNVNGRVIMYADKLTPAISRTVEETNRRRKLQLAYNEKHGITPQTIRKKIDDDLFSEFRVEGEEQEFYSTETREVLKLAERIDRSDYVALLEEEMKKAAQELRFEDAMRLRDELYRLKKVY